MTEPHSPCASAPTSSPRARESGSGNQATEPDAFATKTGSTNEREEANGDALAEALSYVAAWHGKVVVIKFGGRAMAEGSVGTLIEDVALLHRSGIRPVLVHGGGPEITELLEKLDVPARFVDGLRVTDQQTMKAVEMVLGGHVNKRLVGQLHACGARAVGLSGKDGNLLEVRQHPRAELGFVGRIQKVNPELLTTLLDASFVPVIASLGAGPEGRTYNINADTAAAAISVALGAEKFILLTDVDGVLDEGELVSSLDPPTALALLQRGVVSKGMIPKVEACLSAVQQGTRSAHIISAGRRRALLLELFTDTGIGTMISAGSWGAQPFRG